MTYKTRIVIDETTPLFPSERGHYNVLYPTPCIVFFAPKAFEAESLALKGVPSNMHSILIPEDLAKEFALDTRVVWVKEKDYVRCRRRAEQNSTFIENEN